MSALDEVFREEYERLARMKSAMEKERDSLPKGYISRKTIGGKPYGYLQKRVAGKLNSTYVAACKIPEMEKQVARRRQLETSIREANANMRKLKKVID